ncbi:MAG TPA: hypothetical protein VJZ78_00790 [Anaerolineales bacterium]|nr:hypothetical protein [Anaerolineales bacterium]
METRKSGAQISKKAFIQSVLIIFLLMLVAGIMTKIVPAGNYERIMVDGRETIDPGSFQYLENPDYPIWRWFTAPLEVLGAEGNITLIAIILFILLVGIAFAVMDKSGILHEVISRIIRRFGGEKYALLLVISFFFMALGAFFGIFEEVIPLVPIIIALSFSLGWDSMLGLGMSILATNLGFSLAVFNPFTIGISQQLAELPLFSGALPRILLFIVGYGILAIFLTRYGKKIDSHSEKSPVFMEDTSEKTRLESFKAKISDDPRVNHAIIFLSTFFILILAVLIGSSFVPFLSDYALPLTGLLFVIGGVGSGLIAGAGKETWKAVWDGFVGISPAIPLLLMAASVRYIVQMGGILDTLLNSASNIISELTPLSAALAIYGITLILEIFISSGSAKAVLLVPLLIPLADMAGVTRQVAVSAYTFGDGFSNLAYPTNAALLITLSLTVVSYPKWLKWILPLWFWIIVITTIFLGFAIMFNYGPF